MSKRTLGAVALTVGVLGFLLSLVADSLGFGTSPGLGWAQISGAVVGLAMAAWGLVQLRAR